MSSPASSRDGAVEVGLNRDWAKEVFSDAPGAELPFSFIYDGKPSSELVGSWKRKVTGKRGSGKTQRILTLTDPKTGLEVRAVATIYTDTPGVDWVLHFTNTGAADTPIIKQVKAVDMKVGPTDGSSPVLHGISGCYPDHWLPFDKPLEAGERVAFGATDGCSSTNHSPFFNVGFSSGGAIVAVGWSGQWTGSVERVGSDGNVRIEAGMEVMHLKLHPGESIRSPRILVLHYRGDEARSYNLFRHTMFAHITPRTRGKLVVPPIAHLSTSFDELNYTDEPSVLSHLKAIKGLGFEYFWLDAYWHRDGFPGGVGNYGVPPEKFTPDPKRFPNGLKPVAEAVKKDGLKFLLWFEPERVMSGTYIGREHPNYVIFLENNPTGLFDLGLPEAREYMTKALLAAIKEYDLSCIRFDYNFSPLPYWQSVNAKDPDRIGMSEIRYVEGLYRMWDDLLKANPGLFIDNCAGGGRRIDLETCSRSIALWRTDATIRPLWSSDFDEAARLNQIMTTGLNRYVPFTTSGQMGPHPYEFRSGVNGGGISFCEDVRPADYPRLNIEAARAEHGGKPPKDLYGVSGYPLEELKRAIAEAKRTRKYYFGDFYSVAPPTASSDEWCVSQYDRPDKHDGMVVIFRRPGVQADSFTLTNLRGIEKDADYSVTISHGYSPEPGVRMSGSQLLSYAVGIPDRPGSAIVEYRQL